MARLKIGIKYCGGCTPMYDRVALVEHISKAVAKTISFVSYQDPEAIGILVVAGCKTNCAQLGTYDHKRWLTITTDASKADAIRILTSMGMNRVLPHR